MTRDLLWRGLLAGVIAAVCATLFARLFAEPQIDLAIAFETAHAGHGGGDEAELVSRATQKGLGLLTALGLYGAAIGGLFSLGFALLYGRAARMGPRSLALLMAAFGFLVLSLVPALKYPPTPPAVGQHETVALRTAAFFLMIALSSVGLWLAFVVRGRLGSRLGSLDAALVGVVAYVALVALGQLALPRIDEVPEHFPASLLWRYRIASLGTQAVLWTALGLSFGALAQARLKRAAHTG